MYMYILCIHICMYIYIHMYVYICIYVYMCTCIYVYMCICVYIYVYMCICVYVYIEIYLYLSCSNTLPSNRTRMALSGSHLPKGFARSALRSKLLPACGIFRIFKGPRMLDLNQRKM